MQKETLDFKQIYQILGERPFKAKENFQKYLQEVIGEQQNPKAEAN